MLKKNAFIVYCVLLVQSAVAAQQPASQQSTGQPQASYETLLEKVKKQEPRVNFKDLRFAYTETKHYKPYGGDRETAKAMRAALEVKDYEKALALSEKVLASNYLDINAHFTAYAAHAHFSRGERAIYHEYVFENLLKSISDSGDGKTMETAFLVISTAEEYAWLSFMGLYPTGQSLVNDKGHHYDKMTAIDPKTNQSSTYFFNIDKPFNWLGNSLKK